MNKMNKLSIFTLALGSLSALACSSANENRTGLLGANSQPSYNGNTNTTPSTTSNQTAEPSNLLTENKTFRIPSEFQNLQSALNEAQKYHPHTFTINILIESGHRITDGAILNRTDLSFVAIQCEDAVVKISGAFPENKAILFGTGTRMPTLNCLFDMEGRGGSGVRVVAGSQIQIRDSAGVKNAGKYGLQVQHASTAYAVRTIWTGAGEMGVYANASLVSAIEADVSGSVTGVHAESGASVNFRGGIARDTEIGISANLSAEVDATYSGGAPGTDAHQPSDVSNASTYGIFARNLARVVFIHGKVHNSNAGILSHNGATVQATSASFSGNSVYDLAVVGGGTIIANGSDAVNLSSSSGQHTALQPNIFTASGAIFK